VKRELQTLMLVCVWGATAPAVGGAFRSYATVVNVQPIVETFHEPVTRRVCSDPQDEAREYTAVAATIGEDIRSQLQRWQAQRSCTAIKENVARERVTGYWVTYRYRGHTSTTRLSYHPGERMPVNVSLSPLP
jgi:uncharacterized protein YcfJ